MKGLILRVRWLKSHRTVLGMRCWGRGSVSSSCRTLVFYTCCLRLLSHTITQSCSTQVWVWEDGRLIVLQPDASVTGPIDVPFTNVPLTFHSLPGKHLNRNVLLTGLHCHTRRGGCGMFSAEFLHVTLVSTNKQIYLSERRDTWMFPTGRQCFHRHLLTIVCLTACLSIKKRGNRVFPTCVIFLLTLSSLFLQPLNKIRNLGCHTSRHASTY